MVIANLEGRIERSDGAAAMGLRRFLLLLDLSEYRENIAGGMRGGAVGMHLDGRHGLTIRLDPETNAVSEADVNRYTSGRAKVWPLGSNRWIVTGCELYVQPQELIASARYRTSRGASGTEEDAAVPR